MDTLDENELKKNVKDKDTWLRFVYLIVFGIVFVVSVYMTFLGSLLQFLAKLFSGGSLSFLSEFGDNLATYQAQVTRFLMFASDEKPFPFAAFPSKNKDKEG